MSSLLRWLLPLVPCALVGLAAAHDAPVLVASDGTVYAVGNDDDVPSKSTDGGKTWLALPRDLFSAVALAEDDEGAIYAATAYDGVFKSTDKGASWKNVGREPVMGYMSSIAFANGVVYAASTRGILTSADRGRTWKRSHVKTAAKHFARETDGTMFVATEEGIAYATKSDKRWRKASDLDPKSEPMEKLPHGIAVRDGVIYVSTISSRVFRSMDKGNTWTSLGGGLPKAIAFTLWSARDGEIYAGFMGGAVYASKDKGATWAPKRPLTLHVYGFAEAGNGTLYAYCHDGVFMSTDRGASWTKAQLAKGKAP